MKCNSHLLHFITFWMKPPKKHKDRSLWIKVKNSETTYCLWRTL